MHAWAFVHTELVQYQFASGLTYKTYQLFLPITQLTDTYMKQPVLKRAGLDAHTKWINFMIWTVPKLDLSFEGPKNRAGLGPDN